MIRFYADFSDNEKLNFMVKSSINQRLLALTKNILNKCDSPKSFDENYYAIEELFPQDFDRKYIPTVLQDLCDLLESEREQVPDVVMEYFLNYLIEYTVEYCDENKISTKEPFAGKKFAEFTLRSEAGAMGIDKEEYIKHIFEKIEDLRYYRDFIFCDTDFYMLDEFSIAQLKVSSLMGIEIPYYLTEEKKIV